MSDNKSCKKGYRYHRISIKGRLIDEHRLVMEKYLGRRLSSDEVVHHIDGDIDNNDIGNLRLMTNSEHVKLHHKQGDLFVPMETRFSNGHIPYNRSISEKIVLGILSAIKDGGKVGEVAKIFGVKRTIVSDILRGRSYSSITGIVEN